MKSRFLFLGLFIFMVFGAEASQTRKVLIIGIDGCRLDALQQATAPNIDSLLFSGMFSYGDWHMGYTISGPSWSDMMTGVWEAKNGVTNNSYSTSNFYQYPYWPTLAKQFKPNLYCVQIVEYQPLYYQVYNASWDQNFLIPSGSGGCATAAQQWLATDSVDGMFVYFEKVDETGHASGFSPTNPAYMQAITYVDSCVGTVLTALKARPNYATEDWLVIIVTDHGGIGTTHGTYTPEERNIWCGYKSIHINPRQVNIGDSLYAAPDPGDYQDIADYPIDTPVMRRAPVHVDVATTAIHHLIWDTGINPGTYAPWNLDGKSWLQAGPFALGVQATDEINAKICPNPSSAMVTLWFENSPSDKISYQVTDMTGRVLAENDNMVKSTLKTNIDLSGLAKGVYNISVKVGSSGFTKKFELY
jgi:hypothetical protein